MAEIDIVTANIAAGQSLSAEADIGNKSIVGIYIPANWTTAGLSFQASIDGGATWAELFDGTLATAAAITVSSITGGTALALAMDPTKLRGFNAIKVRSGTSGSPVNQTNAVAISLITRLAI